MAKTKSTMLKIYLKDDKIGSLDMEAFLAEAGFCFAGFETDDQGRKPWKIRSYSETEIKPEVLARYPQIERVEPFSE